MAAQRGEYLSRICDSFVCRRVGTSARTRIRSSICLSLIGPDRIVKLDLKGDEAEDDKTYPLDTARLRRVVEIAAHNSGWGKRATGKGHAMGIAAHRSFLTYVATVVEVEVDGKGQVHIPNVWTAVDAGTIVSPDNIRNQFEGAAVFGTSLALFGEITATNGAIDQSNFNNFQITRMNRAPRHVERGDREERCAPGGRRRAGSSALCAGIVQRGIRGDRQARARAAAVEDEAGVSRRS